MGRRAGAGKGGPTAKPWEPNQEQIDYGRSILGKRLYRSVCVQEVADKFKLSIYLANKVLDKAQAQVIAEMQGEGRDPLSAMFLFFESVVANEAFELSHRITCAGQIVKMLSLDKLIKAGQNAEDVEKFIARVAKLQTKTSQEAKHATE